VKAVLIAVEYSPVNVHDLLFIGGHLGPSALPAVAANEGVGIVPAAGLMLSEYATLAPGKILLRVGSRR
jgi:NADPH:quinone reductase-like Zn-dependent oxidoreductase